MKSGLVDHLPRITSTHQLRGVYGQISSWYSKRWTFFDSTKAQKSWRGHSPPEYLRTLANHVAPLAGAWIEAAVEGGKELAKTAKCLQIAGGAVYITDEDGEPSSEWELIHNAKLDALESIVDELSGAPLLVAYQYKHDLARILKKFPNAVALAKGAKGNRQIEAWNRGEIEMLCVHPASAGHGLNLQDGGHHLAFYALTWNYEHYAQIIERIGPIRQHQAGHPRPSGTGPCRGEGRCARPADGILRNEKAPVRGLLWVSYLSPSTPHAIH